MLWGMAQVSEQASSEPRGRGQARAVSGRERARSAARLDRLAAPRSHDKWVAERQKAQQQELEQCSFKPKTGRGPVRPGPPSSADKRATGPRAVECIGMLCRLRGEFCAPICGSGSCRACDFFFFRKVQSEKQLRFLV